MRRLSSLLVLALLPALLAIAAGRASAVDYLIEAQFGGPGTVTPSPNVVVPAGGSQTFTFTPSPGCYVVGDVTVDDALVGIGLTEYTFTNVQSDHVLYVSFVPGPHPTTTALDVRPVLGQCAVPETLIATVQDAVGGQVRFFNGATLLGTSTVASGVATYIIASGLPAGSYSFSANYLGTSCAAASSSPAVSYDVFETGPTPLTLELSLSRSTAPLHLPVNAVTTLRSGGAVVTQNGQVTYYEGGTSLGTVTMVFGHSSLSIAETAYGTHTITAVAQLSLCVATSVTSEAETLFVLDNKAPASVTLSMVPAQVNPGGSVTLRAAVQLPGAGASGKVHFFDVTNGIEVGTASLVNGVATFTYGPVSGSNRWIQALHNEDVVYQSCSSNTKYLQIGPSPAPPPTLFPPPFPSYGTGQNSYPSSVAIADFNADGRPDLAATNWGASNVLVMLGASDGTFGIPTQYLTGSFPEAVAIADLNADGRLDLAVVGPRISVLLGRGDGTFMFRTDMGTGGNSVAIADVNADGKADLAVADRTGNRVSMLLGNGDGTFQPKTHFATGRYPSSVAIADLNGDARPDLVAADADPPPDGGEVSVRLGNGDGTFGPRSTFVTGQNPYSVSITDLNADGQPDLATPNLGHDGLGNTVSVLLGNGDGTFGPQTEFGTGNGPMSVAIGDLDADGRPDLAVANHNSHTVSVLPGNGNGTFQPKSDFVTGVDPRSVAIADFDGDSRLDLAVANFESHTVTVLPHKGPYTVTVTTVGNGTVTKSPDLEAYPFLTDVTLTATPAAGYHFVTWSGDIGNNSSNPLTFTILFSTAVTATFSNMSALSAVPVGNGTVDRSPDQAQYLDGTVVTLTAHASDGWLFAGWSGDATGTDSVTTVTMNGDKTVYASFAVNTYDLTVYVSGNGTIQRSPELAHYPRGSTVRLTAIPDPTTLFIGWNGAATGSANPVDVVMSADKTITGFFYQGFVISVTIVGEGTVTKNPDQTAYLEGSVVSLTATPASGWVFDQWSGDVPGGVPGNTPNLDVEMYSDVNLTATFHQGQVGVADAPLVFALEPVRPNPAHGATGFDFTLPMPARVRMTVVDVGGREVAQLANGERPAGRHHVLWNASLGGGAPAAGVYFVRLHTELGTRVRRFLVVP